MSIALPILLIAGCSGVSSSTVPLIIKTANLTGTQEVPSVTTTATGEGTFIVDTTTRAISGRVTTTNLTGTIAHIHPGAPSVSGSPIVPLFETTTGSGIWEVPTGTVLSTINYELFLNSGLYVNVHSDANPTGEIRGQISIQ